ncbi:hypothetical protein K493DRAFT_342818 [Basidiobolus meristosporus CBS 931.73]|uniref:Kinesin motor domain-containing protein n=1 Tax=Basidiobolus meristosporus CBS 931.73 TaxID=1314790 RepID=A0A1Y1WYK1_9FUNG|nr:hypothetical protein K493DRAFT_342818 [Basidiobolus meristosporus CBS 931.73]|eukprot:ORX78266.1 hypothetical protein K493DRAFT_342818 [Basidiobolus meristosporus CBS 931.73]
MACTIGNVSVLVQVHSVSASANSLKTVDLVVLQEGTFAERRKIPPQELGAFSDSRIDDGICFAARGGNLTPPKYKQQHDVQQNQAVDPVCEQAEGDGHSGTNQSDSFLRASSTTPFVFAIRFETSGNDPTSGTLYLVDMGVPQYIPVNSMVTEDDLFASTVDGVSKSFCLMRRTVSQLISGSFLGPLPYEDTCLTPFISDFFSGNCKSLFVFNVAADDGHLDQETVELLEFAQALRKMRTREKLNKIDRRVTQLEVKQRQYKNEVKNIQIEYKARYGTLCQQETLLQEFQGINHSLENKIHDLAQDCIDVKKQYKELQTSEVTSMLDAKVSSSAMSAEMVTVKEDARRARVHLSIVTAERDNLVLKCTDLQLKLAALQKSFEEKTGEYEKSKDSLLATKIQLESIERMFHTLRLNYRELKEAHSRALGRLTSETQEAQKLHKEKAEIGMRLQHERKHTLIASDLEKRFDTLELILEKEIEAGRRQLFLEKSGNVQKARRLEGKVSELEQTIDRLQEEARITLDTYEKQRNEMMYRVEETSRELHAEKAKNAQLLAKCRESGILWGGGAEMGQDKLTLDAPSILVQGATTLDKEELLLTSQERIGREDEPTSKALPAKPPRKRRKSLAIAPFDDAAEESAGQKPIKSKVKSTKKRSDSSVKEPEPGTISQLKLRRSTRQVGGAVANAPIDIDPELKHVPPIQSSEIPTSPNSPILQRSPTDTPKDTHPRKKITFNRKRQHLGISNENADTPPIASTGPTKKKKVTIGKKQQSLGTVARKEFTPEPNQAATLSADKPQLKYTPASSTGQKLKQSLGKPRGRNTILGDAKSRKLKVLSTLPPSLAGTSRSSILDRKSSAKSTNSQESIKSIFNVSKMLHK